MYNGKRLTLTITSSRRWHLLERVLRAFVLFCRDLEFLDDVVFFDDSSAAEEKVLMESLLSELFTGKTVSVTHFYPDSFSDGYRHSRILNCMRDKLIETGSGYFFLLEDDYLFMDFFDLLPGLDLLSSEPKCAHVSYYQSMKKFPAGMEPEIREFGRVRFWRWPYDESLPLNCNLFHDDVGSVQTLVPGFWISFINWPSFSLRPGLNDTVKFLSIGEFSTDYDLMTMRTELEFSIRWSKKWMTYCHERFLVVNLGWDQSNNAYTLNGSN